MTAAERDPGLQPERTRLAWRRTTLSCTVVALLAGKQALHGGVGTAGVVALSLSALAWLGFLRVANRRVQGMGTARPRPLARGRRWRPRPARSRWPCSPPRCSSELARAHGTGLRHRAGQPSSQSTETTILPRVRPCSLSR